MNYLTTEQLAGLTPYRRKVLLKSIHKKLTKSIKVRKEFDSDIAILLCPTATLLNAYLLRIKKLVEQDGNDTGSVSEGSSLASASDASVGS